ncbi:DsbA family oxidoreductase [Shewanella sp. M-Br]|uniref:DsbA family oxidoreductase n=1 Tax=Shewanella sp. M-Br TaxID=2495595 RepID=UPI002948E550|nr:hypothetical protein SMBr_10720 [Shewanella sp. M-Br]
MNQPLIIDYYSDILCVWAWVAQQRIDELNQKLENKIYFKYHYLDVFGDVQTKIETQWKQKGQYNGFAEHVHKSASIRDDVPTNSKIWTEVRPTTSANAHLVLKAIELIYDKNTSINMALKFRSAFFIDALDIGKLEILYDLVDFYGLEQKKITSSVHDGSAIAALMSNYQKSAQQDLQGSPSYIIDEGRQIFYGNVGYRVLLANIEALL